MAQGLGVIFDMDGVLVDSTEAHYEAWRRTGDWFGQPYPRELFNRTFGMHNRQSIALWLGHHVPEEERHRIAEHKEMIYRQVALDSLRPIPHVVELIRALAQAKFALAVGSSGPAENIQLALNLLGVRSLFQTVVSGDEIEFGKPNPEVFLKAAHKLGLPPDHCAVIEDAPPGIEAAHNGGMVAIAIPTSRTPEEIEAADRVVHDFSQITPQQIAELILATRPA